MRCLSIFKKLLFELRVGLIGVRRIYLLGILLMVVFETVKAGNPSSLVESGKDYNPFASLLKDHSLPTDPLKNNNSAHLHQSEVDNREYLELQSAPESILILKDILQTSSGSYALVQIKVQEFWVQQGERLENYEVISIQENNLLLKHMVPDSQIDEKIFVLGFQNAE
ncbi:MAG TPA: hypothetical protein QF683_10110 [SAR324 cluster bacterium]|nr:hypothetical protein [Deltaproteobacteria bacterium]HJO44988.1 hypothetical protein [SAR324 cluster bacterium]